MYIWAPVGNPTSINEANAQTLLYEPQFWMDYYNETSEAKRANFLETWVAPGNVGVLAPVTEPEVAPPTPTVATPDPEAVSEAEPAKVDEVDDSRSTDWLSN